MLLVPGYGGGTGGLEVLADALRAQGREVVVVDLPGDNTGDLDEQARALDKAVVLADASATGARSVDVVGLLRRRRGGPALGRATTAATAWPAASSRSARRTTAPTWPGSAPTSPRTRCPEACQQLQPDSELLRKLNAGDETPAGPLWVSIWTTDDQIVVPPPSADLDGALDFSVQSVCPGADGQPRRPARDPAVIAAVTRELAVADARRARAARSAPAPLESGLDVLGREVGPAGAEEHHARRRPAAAVPRTTSRQWIGSRNRSTKASQ